MISESRPERAREGAEGESRILLVALQASIQCASGRRSVVGVVQLLCADAPASFPIEDAVKVPNLGTLHREAYIHVALHTLLFVHKSDSSTLLAGRGKIFVFVTLVDRTLVSLDWSGVNCFILWISTGIKTTDS